VLEGGRCIVRVDRALVSGGRRGLTMFDLTSPRHLRGERFLDEIGHYSGTPWFVDTVRLGVLTVKIGPIA
jgi:hypothetical protein